MNQKIAEKTRRFNVAVVGATGAVGVEMVKMLDNREFPVLSLKLLASERSAGKELKFHNKSIGVKALSEKEIEGLDIAIFSAGATISKEYAPLFAKKGVFVIDNSSAWRMDKEIPLVVPEVNSHVLSADKKIIANPNCSTIQMLVALKPLHDKATIERIRVATYQAVSGAGSGGIQDLENQTRAWAEGKPIPPSTKLGQQIAFNVVPHIDKFVEGDYTKEEMKMVNETRKIFESPDLHVSATCVRVPVFRGHSEAVWIETKNPLSPKQAIEILKRTVGVKVIDDPANLKYPMPLDGAGSSDTYVGRIRKDLASPNGLVLWVVSDNLLKGAALNAVQIAETLVEKGILK